MTLKLCAAAFAAVIAVTLCAAPTADAAQSQKKRTAATKKVAAKSVANRPVPLTMAAPRARITVQRRTFLDPGRHINPGSQSEYTDYAFPPGYSPTSVIDNKAGHHRSPLPGPFELPGNYPWNW